ncbi:MAG: hypothetical protein SPI77_00445 [Corynebacterium sp.]|nr:hypothetical protein [Corynebacterium sp.]
MATNAIVSVKLALTDGDVYTLYAPSWKQHGVEWQAFLGDENRILFFHSPAEMLTWIGEHPDQELTEHPKWGAFAAEIDTAVVPDEKNEISLIEVPRFLAERPSYENVTAVQKGMELARSIGNVGSLLSTQTMFATHSVLNNINRGYDHYAGEGGEEEWTGVGYVILENWDNVLDEIDAYVTFPDVEEVNVPAAQERITAAQARAAEKAAADAAAAEAAAANVDPYDESVWANVGIDPIQIVIDGRTLYTLRSFVEGQPKFLGKHGDIYTFNNRKALTRWIIEHDDHDLGRLSTWQELVDAANAGDLELLVHKDNTYVFSGLRDDIAKGPDAVDTQQMARAAELFADTADWAADDSMNATMLANPIFDKYLKYMIGGETGYTPGATFTEELEGWVALENTLTARFTKF